MSTFDGFVHEFPEIRIDHFRPPSVESGRPAPLAYFLSHVHSDHLVGLESCKSRFIYCSPGTRDIILRLEKYVHRINFARGILEARRQSYRYLKSLLKAIPLDTPTEVQLKPGTSIRVTLIDANHCVGAVMFLIEGHNRAILYSGDIRAEPWWIDSLERHPILMPYCCFGDTKRLDNLYLDTTFATKADPYRDFPSKAQGVRELLRKVALYPPDTLFYFDSWTFGYEDVWQALSNFLNEKVHVDDYRYGLYQALANGVEPKALEAPMLSGFYCGNHHQPGCLTRQQTRLHSCERGTSCSIWNADFVRITPIINRYGSKELPELGTGGGHNDLSLQHKVEVGNSRDVQRLMSLPSFKRLKRESDFIASVQAVLQAAGEGAKILDLDGIALNKALARKELESDGSIDDILPSLLNLLSQSQTGHHTKAPGESSTPKMGAMSQHDALTRRITFPYSRHSSYRELCQLVKTFKPREIYPCTVDEDRWTSDRSMQSIFGHLYDATPTFRHDRMMQAAHCQKPRGLVEIHPGPPKVSQREPTAAQTPSHGHAPHELAQELLVPPLPYSPHKTRRENQAASSSPKTSARIDAVSASELASPPSLKRRRSQNEEHSGATERSRNNTQLEPMKKLRCERTGSSSVYGSLDRTSEESGLPTNSTALDINSVRAAMRWEMYESALTTQNGFSPEYLISINGHQKPELEL